MGVYHPYPVICPRCENRFNVDLVNAVNVTRFPALKRQLLARSLNRARCNKCGYESVIEKPFLYVDLDRRLNIAVYPRKERHFHERAAAHVSSLADAFKGTKAPSMRTARVVFGLEELREKIVADDADYADDRVELMKLYVLREHPFLFEKRRLRVTLDEVTGERAAFNCTFDHDASAAYQVNVPRAYLDALHDNASAPPREGRKAKMPATVSGFSNTVFGAKTSASWVNLWKLNPGNDALAALSAYAQAVRAGKPVDLDSAAFEKMLATLPRGNQLSSWAKRDLQTLSDYASKMGNERIEDLLFEVRFGFDLEDDWWRKNKDRDDITTIWGILDALPDIAVEGNTWIKSIKWDDAHAGGGYYNYWTTQEIFIGSGIQSDTAAFREVLLHEVGHSVQKKFEKAVDSWLTTTFGWRIFDPNKPAEIDAWVALAGGYPANTGTQTKVQVRGLIQESLGQGGTFNAAQIASGPVSQHLWNSSAFGARAAFEKTGSNWWNNCTTWHSAGGVRLFVNYHYRWLMAVNEATVQLVTRMPKRYAAMSPLEFFAELFAWHFDARAPNRQNIPPDVTAWFNKTVGTLAPSSPFGPTTVASAASPGAPARGGRKTPRRR